MTPTTNSLMQITDGTTTITLMDSAGGLAYGATGYRLKYGGYAPKVASKREVILGGQTPYNDVEEQLIIEIKGSTSSDCYTKLETLIELLDQATRWFYDENVNPVVIKYQPKGSNLAGPPQRLILKAKADNDTIQLPTEYDDAGTSTWLAAITINLVCRGLWITSLGTDSASGSAHNSGVLNTITSGVNPTLPAPSEIKIDLSTATLSGLLDCYGYFFVVSQANQLGKFDASNFTTTHVTSVADTANKADGNVMKFAPTAVNEDRTTTYQNLPNQLASKKLGFYITYNIDVAGRSFQVGVKATDRVGGTGYDTPLTTLTGFSTATQKGVAYLGSISCDGISGSSPELGLYQFALHLIGPSSIASNPNLYIDTVIVVGLDDDYTSVSQLTFNTSLIGRFIYLRNQPLSRLFPVARTSPSAATTEGTFSGRDGNIGVWTKGTTITVCYLSTMGQYWRLVDSTPNLLSLTITATRDNSYLVPV